MAAQSAAGGLITQSRQTQTKLPPFFSNLLPEGALREYLAKRAGVNAEREFFLIWVLGQDLPGALVVRPADGQTLPSGLDDNLAQRSSNAPLRFSLAGVQLKFSALERAAGGLTIPARGVGGEWIFKLPSLVHAYVVENEFAMMSLARAVGIDVPEFRMAPLDEVEGLPDGLPPTQADAFAIKRFDRTHEGGGKIHIEDFAQVFGLYPARKYGAVSYANIGDVIFVPLLVGVLMPDGQKHDGFFVVRDTGAAIKGPSRFDFYTGLTKPFDPSNPFYRLGFMKKENAVAFRKATEEETKMVLERTKFPKVRRVVFVPPMGI